MGDPRRIEIDWGALEGFMESYEKLTQSFSGVSESFRKILRAMALINGGMGNTAPAADQLDSRLANYDRLREEAAANGRTMVEELLKDCKTNDEKVARLKLAQEYLHEAQLRDQKKLSELHEKLLNSEKELLDTKVSLVRNYVKALVLIDLDDQEAVNKIVNGSNDPRLREVAIQLARRYKYEMEKAEQDYIEGLNWFEESMYKTAKWWNSLDNTALQAGIAAAAIAAIAATIYFSGGAASEAGITVGAFIEKALISGATFAVIGAGGTVVYEKLATEKEWGDIARDAIENGTKGLLSGFFWGPLASAKAVGTIILSGFATSLYGDALWMFGKKIINGQEITNGDIGLSLIKAGLSAAVDGALAAKFTPKIPVQQGAGALSSEQLKSKTIAELIQSRLGSWTNAVMKRIYRPETEVWLRELKTVETGSDFKLPEVFTHTAKGDVQWFGTFKYTNQVEYRLAEVFEDQNRALIEKTITFKREYGSFFLSENMPGLSKWLDPTTNNPFKIGFQTAIPGAGDLVGRGIDTAATGNPWNFVTGSFHFTAPARE